MNYAVSAMGTVQVPWRNSLFGDKSRVGYSHRLLSRAGSRLVVNPRSSATAREVVVCFQVRLVERGPRGLYRVGTIDEVASAGRSIHCVAHGR